MDKKFGELVKQYRGNRSLQNLGNEIGVTASYLSDIEKGNRIPSIDKVDKLIKVFKLEGKEKNQFYDLVAYESPNKYKVSGDIAEYIMKNDYLRELIRLAKEKNVKKTYWKNKIEEIKAEGA